MKQFLFVCGCARSGTSVIANLLMSHPAILIGLERYIHLLAKKQADFVPELFDKERFFDVRDGDTFYSSLEFFNRHYEGTIDKFDQSIYVGDKIPRLFNYFPRIRDVFPRAKVIFITRDLSDVASSFKRRAMDENDPLWSKNRTVASAINDWNAAHRAALENFNHLDLFVIKFETWLEDDNLAPLFDFLELPVTPEVTKRFREIRALSPKLKDKKTTSNKIELSPSEKTAIANDGDLISYQKLLHLAKAANRAIAPDLLETGSIPTPSPVAPPTNPSHKYAAEDWEIVDYSYTDLPQTKRTFRGPFPDENSLENGQFISYLGAAQTFGRLVEHPFPSLVQKSIGLPVLNLAHGGAKPQFYLQNPSLLNYVNRSRCAVIQIMSARGLENAEFLPAKEDNVFLKRKSDLSAQPVFADHAYGALLKRESPERVLEIVSETQDRWVNEMLSLLEKITVPTILLWFSRRSPEWTPLCTNKETLMGEFPHFINKTMLDSIRKKTGAYVECISKPTPPRIFYSRFTGLSVEVPKHTAQYYPDQGEHKMVAESLCYALKIILKSQIKQ